MISFIIIGKNEGWKLLKSIESVYKAIEINKIEDSEVIYVDSRSTDNTLDDIKIFKNLIVAVISGDVNAAVARNIGFKESKNNNLIFIDGDMEIKADFLPLILDSSNNLKYPFCSGNWINYNYLNFENKNILNKKIKKKMTSAQTEFVTGGLFAIKREVWESVGGMKTIMKRSQDWDLALRLSKKGVFLYRLKEIFAIHHTLPPKESVSKMWKMFFLGYKLYRIVILRNNFFNKYQWKHFIRINYSFLALILSLLFGFFQSNYSFLIVYFGVLILKNFVSYKKNFLFLINGCIINFFYDILYIFALFFFFPTKKELVYNLIKNTNDNC
jgi:glycosyltransferase involved in cell wall biosynthesis